MISYRSSSFTLSAHSFWGKCHITQNELGQKTVRDGLYKINYGMMKN